jgi:hypothetical protein
MELLERDSQQKLLDDIFVQTGGGKGRIALELERTVAEARPGYDLAARSGDPWSLGVLFCWIRRAGHPIPLPESIPPVYRLMADGDWASAAAEWERMGCPFERALALADGSRSAQLEALEIFDGLGARPRPAGCVRGSGGREKRGSPAGRGLRRAPIRTALPRASLKSLSWSFSPR